MKVKSSKELYFFKVLHFTSNTFYPIQNKVKKYTLKTGEITYIKKYLNCPKSFALELELAFINSEFM